MAGERFTVNVRPAQFQRLRELTLDLDQHPERRDTIIDLLTEAWSENGGFFVPAVARDFPVEEIKIVVV